MDTLCGGIAGKQSASSSQDANRKGIADNHWDPVDASDSDKKKLVTPANEIRERQKRSESMLSSWKLYPTSGSKLPPNACEFMTAFAGISVYRVKIQEVRERARSQGEEK